MRKLTPHFEKEQLVNVKDDDGKYITAQVMSIEGINDDRYSVIFIDMQTGDRFRRTYKYN
jgi:hypothetical protein